MSIDGASSPSPGPVADGVRVRLVLVAAPELVALAGRRRPPPPVGLTAFTPAFLDQAAPAAIGLAVFAGKPDAFLVVQHLARLGYRGRVIALAPPLPRRSLVERELRAQAPGLRLRLVCLPALSALP